MRTDVDWAAARAMYVTGADTVTQRVIAKRLGVSREAVGRRAVAEGWSAEREQHRHTIVTMAIQKHAKQASDEIAEDNTVIRRQSSAAARRLMEMLLEYAGERDGFTTQELVGAMRGEGAAILRSLATAAGIMIDKFRLSAGLATAKTEQTATPPSAEDGRAIASNIRQLLERFDRLDAGSGGGAVA